MPTDSYVLNMAVQTILHKNKTRLTCLADERDSELLKEMAQEITYKALALQQITDAVVRELDGCHQLGE